MASRVLILMLFQAYSELHWLRRTTPDLRSKLNVDGCIWIGRGGSEGGGGGESMRDLGKRRRHGLVGEKTDSNWCRCLRSLIFC